MRFMQTERLRGSPETIIFAVLRQNGGFHGYNNFSSSF